MRPRWRAVLRVRMLLRLLIDDYVPLGVLSRQINDVLSVSDRDLPDEQRVHSASMQGALARDLAEQLIDEDPFGPRESAPLDFLCTCGDRPHAPGCASLGMPRDWRVERYVPPAFFNLASLADAQRAVAALPEGSLTHKQRVTLAHVLGQASAERIAAGERLDDKGNLIT